MIHRIGLIAGIALMFCVTGCRDQSEPTPEPDEPQQEASIVSSITGTISYRERIALSPQATVEVSLEDVSRMDVAATVIATQQISSPGQVPIPFEVKFDPADIDERMSYSMRVRIMDGGRLQFINDTSIPVLTRGAGHQVDILVRRVGGRDEQKTSQPIVRGQSVIGRFQYMADAALFEDCRSGKKFPVAMEGAYIELERAYMDAQTEPGAPLTVAIRGRFLERDGMEEGTRRVHVIVDEFMGLKADEDCTPNRQASLENTRWKLVSLGDDQPLEPGATQKEAFFTLRPDEAKVNGNSGCNNFFGSYETADEQLSFGAMGSTMMACPVGMDIEQAFLKALATANRYSIRGEFLTLYTDDQPLAKFEAIYL